MSATKTRRGVRITGIQAGVIMAFAAVAAGSFFQVRPPEAYGICMSCHGRDLVNWLSNDLFGTDLTVSVASLVFPVLTTVGVLIGAFVAAVFSGEFRFRMPSKPLKSFGQGMRVMNLALLAGGCSTRLLLATSAGDLLGLTGFGAMVVGVILATFWLRRRALPGSLSRSAVCSAESLLESLGDRSCKPSCWRRSAALGLATYRCWPTGAPFASTFLRHRGRSAQWCISPGSLPVAWSFTYGLGHWFSTTGHEPEVHFRC